MFPPILNVTWNKGAFHDIALFPVKMTLHVKGNNNNNNNTNRFYLRCLSQEDTVETNS